MSAPFRFRFVTVLLGCALALAMLLFRSGSAVLGQEPTATPTAEPPMLTISGVVFWDVDGDGLRDAGEPGLPGRRVRLDDEETTRYAAFAGPDGTYVIRSVAPGDYVLTVQLEGGVGVCNVPITSFHPIPSGFCLHVTLPWNATTPDSVALTLSGDVTADFGARPADVAVVTGYVILEDDRAPAGTSIEALVNGRECGTTTVTDDPDINFELHVLGARERVGCATSGDAVEFRVAGVTAEQTFSWEAYVPWPGRFFRLVDLVAMEQHAWYWFERFGEELPRDGATVQAIVNGVVCGETTMESSPRMGVAGFSRLIVPSEAIHPGCGRPGAAVSFVVGSVEAETTIPWAPGLQRIDLVVPTLTGTLPPALPDTGSGPARGSETTSPLPALVWFLLGTSIMSLATAVMVRGLLGRARDP